jgi:cytochrome oxidase assembly protein ShyY1
VTARDMMSKSARGKAGGLRDGLLVPTVFVALVLALLVGLGTWQIQRKAWKENLIATLDRKLSAPPEQLPPPSQWPSLTQDKDEFRRVTLTATFKGNEARVYTNGSALRPDVDGVGTWIFAPVDVDGATLVVDRGFMPDTSTFVGADTPARKAAPAAATLEGQTQKIVGVLRWPEERGAFTPNDDVAHNLWFTRDPQGMAQARHWGNVPAFYIEQESPVPPGGYPKPGKLVPALRDAHLQYAITWYGMALVLVGVYGAWLVRRRSDSEVPPEA